MLNTSLISHFFIFFPSLLIWQTFTCFTLIKKMKKTQLHITTKLLTPYQRMQIKKKTSPGKGLVLWKVEHTALLLYMPSP